MKRRSALSSKYDDDHNITPLPLHHHREDDNDGAKQQPYPRNKTSRRRRSSKSRLLYLSFSLLVLIALLGWLLRLRSNHQNASSTTATYYSPRLLSDDEDGVNVNDWEWPFIHIVQTRFMQEQGNLTALGKARLALFQIFCLPTMIQQTSQRFLWIIKADPNLDTTIRNAMIQQLLPFPNFYLVASNTNFRINEQFPGAWRGGAEGHDLMQSKIYTGNQTLLEIAMALADQLPVLETRLDADDGLHVHFLETIQQKALQSFIAPDDAEQQQQQQHKNHNHLKWMYWCAKRVMEWHWVDPIKRPKNSNTVSQLQATYGALVGSQHTNLCVTPGFTVGFPIGTAEQDVPIYAHDKLIVNLRDMRPNQACGLAQASDCLQFVENFVVEAIRSRTHTSAGMLHVNLDDYHYPNNDTAAAAAFSNTWLVYRLWDLCHDSFGLERETVKWLNRYLTDHLLDIARDNLLGQCTTGHSCKEKAKESLESLIAMRQNTSTGVGP